MNYSTKISVDVTVGEIQGLLRRNGAESIMVEYAHQEPSGLAFRIPTAQGVIAYRLPVDVERTLKLLTRQYESGDIPRLRFATREQAGRVCWRTVKDWLEAQIAFIETEMVTLDVVMLPYEAVGAKGYLYEWMRANRKLLMAGEGR